jgi:hypothetical protein
MPDIVTNLSYTPGSKIELLRQRQQVIQEVWQFPISFNSRGIRLILHTRG